MTKIFALAALVAVVLAGTSPELRAQAAATPPAQGVAAANSFNRLFRPPPPGNRPPAEDGIHDPSSPGTRELQAPLEAFGPLPKSGSGNHVDWAASLQTGKIAPRWDVAKPDAKPEAMDLNIVREVKGSTPDVVFSHQRHGQILDCASCHPAIFIPQKGANPMSMASLALGQSCGVCHGRVAFPIAECRACHSKPKAGASPAAAAKPGAGK